jgi:hypothetical protein
VSKVIGRASERALEGSPFHGSARLIRRQTMPVLVNVLLPARGNRLHHWHAAGKFR